MIGDLTNHIWQSTIFAGVAVLMTLAFRKNRAHVRYWLWLSASLKFLLPFSLLMSLGSRVEWMPATQKIAVAPIVAFTVVQISQPFPEIAPFASARRDTRDKAAAGLFGVWLAGFFALVLIRSRGWRQIRAAVRSSTPLDIPITTPIRTRSSPGLLEPGVVGLFRPTLLLPAGIEERLKPCQLKAVLAHELCHARRHDNLTSAIHMLVEAVFWFHPLVWWIGARLVEERERACDQAVLFLGNKPHDYAEGILNVCKNYLESPLICVSGVTGSDLKKRIQAILTGDAPGGLNFAKKSALAVAAAAALAVPIVIGVISAAHVSAESQPAIGQSADATTPKFEVASIKRNPSASSDLAKGPMGVRMEQPGGRLRAQNAPVMLLIERAYGMQAFQVVQGPAWINTEGYDIEAKPEGNIDQQQMWLMLQTLLADRFKLTLHRETRELPVYDLKVAKGGPKLPKAKEVVCVSFPPGTRPQPVPGKVDCGYVAGPMGRTELQLQGSKVQMTGLISRLAWVLGRSVVDKTEFARDFDLNLSFTADEATMGLPGFGGPGDPYPGSGRFQTDPSRPNIFAALEEQLGLKLVSAKGPVDVLVIDHVERPSAN